MLNSTRNTDESPSLLRQIVDEADTLSDVEKAEILRKIKLRKALSLSQQADNMLQGKFKVLSEDEIAQIVSDNRKQRYEQKARD